LLRLGLRAAHQLHEHLALFEHALCIGLLTGDLDRLDILQWRIEAAKLATIVLEEGLEDFRTAIVEPVLALAALGNRADVADFLGITHRVGDQLTLYQPVDQAAVKGFLGADRIAGRAHLQSLLHASYPRQSLCPARAGQQAELNFGRP
jgi:hypothetical protein